MCARYGRGAREICLSEKEVLAKKRETLGNTALITKNFDLSLLSSDMYDDLLLPDIHISLIHLHVYQFLTPLEPTC